VGMWGGGIGWRAGAIAEPFWLQMANIHIFLFPTRSKMLHRLPSTMSPRDGPKFLVYDSEQFL